MLSIAFSATIAVLEQVIIMEGVDAQPGSFLELPDVDQGMIFIRIRPALYTLLASMGAIVVLDDKAPWDKDIYSNPETVESWLDNSSFI